MSISSCRIAKQRDLEVKLAKSAAISIIYFTVSWLPYAVIAGIGVLGYVGTILYFTFFKIHFKAVEMLKFKV